MPDQLYEPQVGMTPKGPNVEMPGGLPSLWVQGAGAATRAAVLAAGATQEMWNQTGQAARRLEAASLEVSQRLQHDRQLDQFARANFGLMSNLYQSREKSKTGDPATWEKNFTEQASQHFEKVLQSVESPQVQTQLRMEFARHLPVMRAGVVSAARTQMIQESKATAAELVQQGLQMMTQAETPLEQGRIRARVFAMLDNKVGLGGLRADQAQSLKMAFDDHNQLNQVRKDIRLDPAGTFHRLREPEKYCPGMREQQIALARGYAREEMHRQQEENYSRYMQNILGATADNPVPGAVMPGEDEILRQINDQHLSIPGGQNILAYVRGQKSNRENKTDPQSYKEAVTRLTDPDHPLTREEFLKNVESGEWRFDAKTYGGFLMKLGARGGQLEKTVDSAFKARVSFWRTQFGGDSRDEHFMTALAQAQTAKDAGGLGASPDEIYKNLDAIFKPNADLYARENFLGRTAPPQQKPGIIGRAWNWATVGGQAGGPGPETVTKDGKTYRVITIKGQKMVDPTPLPQR